MTAEPKPWKIGEPCPASGGEMVHYRPATEAEYAAFTDKENFRSLPPRVDTASPAFIAEHGELWKCEASGYQSRVKPDGDKAAASKRATK